MDAAQVGERTADARRVLLLAPTLADADATAACGGLMAPDEGHPGLYVSLVRPVADVVETWRELGGGDSVAVVTLKSRSAAAAPPVRTEVLSDPGDLTGMGIAVTECLDSLPSGVRVCFDSLTVLLQYVDVERAFRFLHVFSRYLADADGSLHVHLDPAAGDPETVATLAPLFDAVVRYEDGAWTVSA